MNNFVLFLTVPISFPLNYHVCFLPLIQILLLCSPLHQKKISQNKVFQPQIYFQLAADCVSSLMLYVKLKEDISIKQYEDKKSDWRSFLNRQQKGDL